jgi:hypothetical protein
MGTSPLEIWYKVLQDLKYRSITVDSDILPAISAMAKEIQRHIGQEYKAGLWLDDMHRGLAWSDCYHGSKPRNGYVAPSWSWASIDFGTRPLKKLHDLTHDLLPRPDWPPDNLNIIPVAKIIDVKIKNVNKDPFGQVLSGKLVIQAPRRKNCSCRIEPFFFDCHDLSLDPGQFDPDYILSYLRSMPTPSPTYEDEELTYHCKSLNLETLTERSCLKHTQYTLLHIASYYLPESDHFHEACHVSKSDRKRKGSVGDIFIAITLILAREDEEEGFYQRVGLAYFRESDRLFRKVVRTVDVWGWKTYTII